MRGEQLYFDDSHKNFPNRIYNWSCQYLLHTDIAYFAGIQTSYRITSAEANIPTDTGTDTTVKSCGSTAHRDFENLFEP